MLLSVKKGAAKTDYYYYGNNDLKILPTNHTVTVVSCGICEAKRANNHTIRKHGREDWTVLLCENGTLYANGSEVAAGELYIYAPHSDEYYYILKNEGGRYRYLHFTGNDINGLMATVGLKPGVVTPKTSVGLTDQFNSIMALLLDGTEISALKSEALTIRLLIRISDVSKKREPNAILKLVTEKMEHEYYLPYDAGRYADIMHLSISRFDHVFKDEVGVSPLKYFTAVKMTVAKSLLDGTDMKLYEIAEQVGYGDALYFSQIFKKEVGQSPRNYRRGNR